MGPVGAAEFDRLMAPLGPFEAAPRLALAVSGGADSLALALLCRQWAASRGGAVSALIVDHGLRPEAVTEAALAAKLLHNQGVQARILRLAALSQGSALAARARWARYEALAVACAEAGILHLLLGHHAADQAETVLIRALGGSGRAGLAGMAALVETHAVRLLRPLLAVPPVRLRATLQMAGLTWIEDPSNADARALRARLRAGRRDRDGSGAATAALCAAARADGAARAAADAALACALAQAASLHPEGYAVLSRETLPREALAALIRVVAGRAFTPAPAATARLAATLRPATLGGTRLVPAGRFGPGWLLIREASRMQASVVARPGVTWDGRFRLGPGTLPGEATIGALGADARLMRRTSRLPASVLQTLPAIRSGGRLLAVPHLGYDPAGKGCPRIFFSPPDPASGAPFRPC